MNQRATTVEGVRRTNLAEVLRLVHHAGPRSRAVITGETGLNRSTVSDLVGRLVEAGLVEEHEPDPTRRVGRPSPVVVPSPDVVAIGVNPEIDAVEIGAVSLGGAVRERVRIPVEQPEVADVVEIVAGVVGGWRDGALRECRLEGVGVAVPGLVRASDGLVRFAPHLLWRDADIAGPLRAALGVAVVVGNDASFGARAERLFGAAREHEDVVYLNGGASGIGGGLILHGTLIGGVGGYAGEWGQTAASVADAADRRAEGGVLEDEVNRARLVQATGLGAPDDEELRATLAGSGATAAAAEVARQRRILTATLGNAVNVLNPAMIVLGGFLAILRDLDPEAFDDEVRRRALAPSAEGLQISAAALGADRLLIGAADAAFERLLADPLG
ncbi:Sugar kinase of the NBD/HSP70 family, may contain an N-terminal HTH domain [Microbacterium sp. 8M]|uniref:ROK family transcriptional regulator n=1 Tax=Microbacterium sp. 8M TaxID=2653153 RepID=UPI0012F1BD89|nr:ROK family transcriptional regulator [Microbacterium sp. 8M]VXB61924.1 Sugar kinase of the NBD/HSP70 family, may contain an N-terminal HTH domain [Microbacterium sp. 8M]